MFSGSIPALPTPFTREGIDERSFRDHVSWLIEEGSSGLVACGTTGEAASLSAVERDRVLAICVSEAVSRVPVIAGCSAPNTSTVIEQINRARDLGATAAMVSAPHYVRPDQNGLIAHFREIALHGGLPVVLYNVPTRTGVDIRPETIGRLVADYPGVFVALKDATGAIARVSLQREECGTKFCQLSGNDETTLGFMATGGSGCISVTANVAPRLCAEFQAACRLQDFRRAIELHDRLLPLHRALFAGPSPAPLKYALSRIRANFSVRLRLPIVQTDDDAKRLIDEALKLVNLSTLSLTSPQKFL